ncbi:hypothetical protein [Salinivibrio costicola]|uniref:hypothetical protein n=1 Tax=Salinivibrio costicola TaxID=51367 RepID=UPI000FE1421E|nr:hypothetical protein [Salinivibrio costicola]
MDDIHSRTKSAGGHHNYVAEQYVLNTLKSLTSQSALELSDTDDALLSKLHNLDERKGCVLVLNNETCDDFAEIVDVYGQDCNNPTGKGVEGFQVDFDVLAIKGDKEKSFHIVFQTMERSDNLRAYNGIEMATASSYGCDADESQELNEFMDWQDGIFNEMTEIAKSECENWLRVTFHRRIKYGVNLPIPN